MSAGLPQVTSRTTSQVAARTFDRGARVHHDVQRIVRELKANRVRADVIDRVEKTIFGPLDEALRREFERSTEALRELHTCLDSDDVAPARKAGITAAEQLDALVSRTDKIVDAVRELGSAIRLIKTKQMLDDLLGDRE